MSRMFSEVTRTYNPIVGCLHLCSYCWARDLAEGRLRHLPRYRDGFKPQLIESELKRRFNGGTVLVSSMGDAWGQWVPSEWILRVLEAEKQSPNATFLHLTKNPARYHDFLRSMPPNVVLGTTIESNLTYPAISNAPPIQERAKAMEQLPKHFKRFVSIEPILDFHSCDFPWMINRIAPAFVYCGYDNWGNHLVEPSLAKTRELMVALREFTEVRAKTLREAWQPR